MRRGASQVMLRKLGGPSGNIQLTGQQFSARIQECGGTAELTGDYLGHSGDACEPPELHPVLLKGPYRPGSKSMLVMPLTSILSPGSSVYFRHSHSHSSNFS